MKITQGRLGELDALRGIAAVFVVLFHYSVMAGSDLLLLKVGVTGVDLFFMISGYVIFMTLEKTRTEKDFIISRLSRLFPSFIVMMLFTISVIYFFNKGGTPSLWVIFANFTMMQPIFLAPNIDASYWTLTVEMQFYFLMLLVFMAKKLKKIEWIGVGMVGLLLCCYVVAYLFFLKSKLYILPRYMFPLISHFQLFFAGIVFYKIQKEGAKLYRHLLIAVAFIITIFLFDKSGRAHFFIDRIAYTTMISLYILVFYLFVYGKLKFLNIRILSFFGSISYCLYLVHQEAGKHLYGFLTGYVGLNRVTAVGALFLLMVGISALVTYGIERPTIRFIRERWMKKNATPTTLDVAVSDKAA